MKNLIIPFTAIALSVVFISCGSAQGKKIGDAGEKTEASSTTEASKDQAFKLNEIVQLGDYVITVTKAQNNVPAPDEFTSPEKGKKFVAIEVVYENKTSRPIDYNPLDWQLIDGEGYSFDTDHNETKGVPLNSGTLNPGQKVKGWVNFSTTKESKDLKAQFTPSLISDNNVQIQLGF